MKRIVITVLLCAVGAFIAHFFLPIHLRGPRPGEHEETKRLGDFIEGSELLTNSGGSFYRIAPDTDETVVIVVDVSKLRVRQIINHSTFTVTMVSPKETNKRCGAFVFPIETFQYDLSFTARPSEITPETIWTNIHNACMGEYSGDLMKHPHDPLE